MKKSILPITLTLIFTAGLLLAGNYSKNIGIVISNNNYLNKQFNYQILLLIITAFSLSTTFLLNKENFKTFFSFGRISSIGQELKMFGIKQGDSWLKTGLSLCVVISIVTATFMYFQLKQVKTDWSVLQNGIFWIILFSLTNSFGEEMIYRLGIVSPLKSALKPTTIFLISAILFGLPHFAGMPNGIIGASMAGILGFVLAKSMFETNGFFWAWTIHFLQDVIIIGTLFLINNTNL
jgi:membrane protease YdiL (CAAX protease family)